MKNNVFVDFMNSLTEDYLNKEFEDFIKYLGFSKFERSETSASYEIITAEVYGFDDRRVFISVFKEMNSIVKGRYVITDENCLTLDNIVFKRFNNKWVEE